MPVKAGPLAAAGGGVLLVWSGLRGRSWSTVLRDVIGGQSPSIAATAYQIEPGTADGTSIFGGGNFPSAGTAGPLSSVARRIAPNLHYVFGGIPSQHEVDCSSLVNASCFELKLAVPLDRHYTGLTHGPDTIAWLGWTGCKTIPHAQAQADDLAIWPTHMGIFTGPDTVISALNPRLGIRELPLKETAPGGEPLTVRRLKGNRMAGF